MGRLQYLREAEASAMNQTVTCEVLRLVTDKSLSENVNTLLNAAKGEYIKILPDDDLLLPDAIESLEKKIEEGYDFVVANAINFRIDGSAHVQQPLNPPVTIEKMIEKNQIHGGTVLYRKDALMKIGGMDETLWTAEEYDLHLRMMLADCKWGYLDKIVFKYRLHKEQKSLGAPKDVRAKRKIEIKRLQDKYRQQWKSL